MQQQVRFLDASRFAIVAAGEHVWCLARDVKDQNFFAPFQLTCRRADNGEVVWKSGDLSDYAQVDLVGPPLLADGKLFITAKTGANPQMPQQGQPQQLVLAIQPHDGKILWKTEVGLFRQGGQRYFWYGYGNESSPQPQLIYRAGAVYADTHIGVLARLDADTGALDWGYGYKTDPFQSGYRRFYYYMSREPTAASSPPLSIGRNVPDQGGAVGASLRHRAQPDEGPLGAADHEVVAAARRRRAYLVPRRGGDQRAGPRDAETLLGDPGPERQHGGARPGPSGRPVATDVPRHLRDRPEIGPGPPDLPRQGPRRRGRRPAADRPMAPGRFQSHDLRLPAPVVRGPRRRPPRSRDPKGEGFEMMPTTMMPRVVEPARPAIAAIALVLALLGAAGPAQAQFFDPTGGMMAPTSNIEGFTVSGKGHAEAKPNLVEIDMDVSASSELTADAIVKYRDAKKRIRDAFSTLKLANVAVEERGLMVDQKGQMQSPYFFDYQPNTRNKTEVQLSRKLVAKATDIRKMDEESVLQLVGKLLDVAQDAGANVGPQNQYV